MKHEANIIMKLCHPNLPFLFGVCTATPYKLVLQYHGLKGCSVTLAHAITREQYLTCGEKCLLICVQMMEALRYLHDDAGVLHNDIKCNSILLTNPGTESDHDINIIIIDFGKATYVQDHYKLRLKGLEQTEYIRKYSHIAPEVIEGTQPYSCKSDIFSAGGIIYKLGDTNIFSSLPSDQQHAIMKLAEMCRLAQYHKRPSATKALAHLQNLESA